MPECLDLLPQRLEATVVPNGSSDGGIAQDDKRRNEDCNESPGLHQNHPIDPSLVKAKDLEHPGP